MRNIAKGAEPKSLETHRCTPFAHYNNFNDNDKQNLREALVTEQRGLCCYCLRRIVANSNAMKIEHWQSQKHFPERQLDYSNLLGACLGGDGMPPKLQHCDTRKGDQVLSKNPASSEHDVERTIRYDKDGTIHSTDPVFDNEINQVLNLNLSILKNNRKAVLQRFLTEGSKRGGWNDNWLAKRLAEWEENSNHGEFPEYCQVVIYWLRKRLKRT